MGDSRIPARLSAVRCRVWRAPICPRSVRSLRPCLLCRERGLNSQRPLCPLFLSWGVPLAITAAAVALKKIGYDASDVSVGWCWIDLDAEDRVLWMLLTGKLWEMLAYVMLPVLYLLIRKHINRAVGACGPPSPPAQTSLWPLCPAAGCWARPPRGQAGMVHRGPNGRLISRPWQERVLSLLRCG